MCIDPADKPCIYNNTYGCAEVCLYFLSCIAQAAEISDICRRYWVPSITTQARIHSLMEFHGTRYPALSLSDGGVGIA